MTKKSESDNTPVEEILRLIDSYERNLTEDEFLDLCISSVAYLAPKIPKPLIDRVQELVEGTQMNLERLELFTQSSISGSGRIPIKGAVIVEPDHLRSLNDFLKDNFAKVTYQATSNKGYTLSFPDFESLLNYENPDHRKIHTVTIFAIDNEDPRNKIEINFGSESEFREEECGSVSLQFFNVRQLDHVELEILRRINQMQPWYSWIRKYGLSVFTILFPLIYGFFFLVYFAIAAATKLQNVESLIRETYVIHLIITGLLFPIGYFIDRMDLFPSQFFCIGMQKKSFEKKQFRANLLLIGVGLTMVVGLFVNFLSERLF